MTSRNGPKSAYRAVHLLAALAAAAGLPAAAFAASGADAAYTVANYPVEATAQDAVKAKERALADGQQAAFRSLLKRIVPVTSYNRLARLKAVKAGDLVDGVSVREESNSSTRYIASLDFTFSAKAVRDLLKREGVPYIDTLAPQTVLVVAARNATGAPKDSRDWLAAWKGLDLSHTLTPVRIEALKPAIHADTLKMASSGDGAADRILKGEYAAERVVLALLDEETGGKLTVNLAGTDAVGPFMLKRSYKMAPGDTAYTMELAAVIALGVLEGRWKAVQANERGGETALSGPGAPVDMRVEFQSLAEWNDIRGRLLEVDGIEDVRIDAVSARGADVRLVYPGGADRLASELGRRGLTLKNQGAAWVLRAGS